MRFAFRLLLTLLVLIPASLTFAASAPMSGPLTVYFIDVEGGQSTLFVTPDKHSLLVDTGWPDHSDRDADRIVAAAKDAGLDHIDYVLITHFHVDHVGGVPQLASKIKIGTFIDHGVNRETSDAATEKGYEAYKALLATGKYKRITPKLGDTLPIPGLHAVVVSEDGNLIQKPLPGGGEANQYCASSPEKPADQTENARSLGIAMTYGKLRMIDLGDLTWDKERSLVCPANKLGHVDIYIVSHHGWDHSSSPAFVDGLAPRVAIMDNGETKGGSASTLDIIRKSPRLETLWQLHASAEGGAAHNTPDQYIANLMGPPDVGNYLKLTVMQNGSFSVYNPRTRETKDYAAK